jgi:D-alanyl-lipoteichoic acid acyltransferase DltB (MBOAT superfamily)
VLFQTPEFFCLFVAVLIGIAATGRWQRGQQWLVLVASYVFYGWWDVRYLMLLVASSLVDYSASLGIEGVKLSRRRLWGMSALVCGAALVFLGINWPALQRDDSETSIASWFGPQWPGAMWAIAITLILAAIGPFVYQRLIAMSPPIRRRAFLWTSIAANLGILGFFKYFNFFLDNLIGLGRLFGWTWQPAVLEVVLPVGISFYTFQTMSYTIDVYRNDIEPERSLLRVALYVAYFPQLVAGPILRAGQLLPALGRVWTLGADQLTSGFHQILVGLIKKVLIADSIAPLVDAILNQPQGRPSLLIYLGAALFAAQIYCDFSGYTDIALGISRVFGVELPLNFNYPYFSTSIIEFWRRWHISLSTWLRDYLYIPLGGSRRGTRRLYGNVMATMLLGGLWHGAAWNFVAWGGYQGLLLCANRPLREIIQRSPKLSQLVQRPIGAVLRWALTMYLVLLGWLIFRVSGSENLWYAIHRFVVFDGRWDVTGLGVGTAAPFTAVSALVAFVILHTVSFAGKKWPDLLDTAPRPIQLSAYVLLGFVFFFAWPSEQEPFIYFQF